MTHFPTLPRDPVLAADPCIPSDLAPRSDDGTKPLFIPLRREYFEAFRDGSKTHEYRLWGPRWNSNTCRVGRPVILSLGYGKKHRLTGRIDGFHIDPHPQYLPGWITCYGEPQTSATKAACIKIILTPGQLPT